MRPENAAAAAAHRLATQPPGCRPPHTPARTPRLPAPSAQEPPNRTRRACASRAWRAMETVDLKLVLLGAPRRAHPGPALPWRGAPAVRVAPRAPGSSGSLHTLHSATADPPSALRCAGQPGVGKTCLVYRYLYNTFGETISVRARLPPRLMPSQRAVAPRCLAPVPWLSHCHHLSPPVTRDPCHHRPLPPPTTTCHHVSPDHRSVLRDEEGGGQRQNLQPRHLGHRRPGALR